MPRPILEIDYEGNGSRISRVQLALFSCTIRSYMLAPVFSLGLLVYVSTNDPTIYALVGAGAGVYLFYRGFRMLQRKRLIENTPTSKIRSAAMGLVEVNGLANGPYTIPAPVSQLPCYFHRTMVWIYVQSGKNKRWKKVVDARFHVPFYLEDETGRVLVDPSDAELDIHRDFQQEYQHGLFQDDPIPSNVSHFLAMHGVERDHPIKIEEYCIKPKNALFILGTLAENPGIEVREIPVASDSPDAAWRKLAAGAIKTRPAPPPPDEKELQARAAFAAAMGFHVPAGTPHPAAPPQKPAHPPAEIDDAEKQRRELFMAGLMGTSPQTASAGAAFMAATTTTQAAQPNQQHPVPALDSEEQKRRQLALASLFGTPAVAAAVAASQAQNAAAANGPMAPPTRPVVPFDLHPPVVLMKGTHNPAFLISWHSQRDLLSELAWKSTLYIWGGPILTLVSVGFVLSRFGSLN
ncbi:MAG TPA: GIDE domain-containing protein [Terriglobales bacterium]|nr:GIDE domain-containing protein [Terriglobales bacterium]